MFLTTEAQQGGAKYSERNVGTDGRFRFKELFFVDRRMGRVYFLPDGHFAAIFGRALIGHSSGRVPPALCRCPLLPPVPFLSPDELPRKIREKGSGTYL